MESKTICLYISTFDGESMGLFGLQHSADTLKEVKKWFDKNKNDLVYDVYQIDDLKKGETVTRVTLDAGDLPF